MYFCTAAVGFGIVIFIKLWRVGKTVILNLPYFKFRLINVFFYSKNGTCLYYQEWDTEKGKCIREYLSKLTLLQCMYLPIFLKYKNHNGAPYVCLAC